MSRKQQGQNPLLAAIARAAEPVAEAEPLTLKVLSGSSDSIKPAPEESASKNRRSRSRQARAETRLIAGHFDPAVARQLKLLAAEEDTTIQALLAEALDLLFVKKGKGKIAGLVRR